VFLSSSYLTLDPIGISTNALDSAGKRSPGVTSCHGWVMKLAPRVSVTPPEARNPGRRGRLLLFSHFVVRAHRSRRAGQTHNLNRGWKSASASRRLGNPWQHRAGAIEFHSTTAPSSKHQSG